MLSITVNVAGLAEKVKVIVDGEEVGVVNSIKKVVNFDCDTREMHIIKVKNINGSSIPIKVSSTSGKEISLIYNPNMMKAFREGYYELTEINGADFQENIVTGNKRSPSVLWVIFMITMLIIILISIFANIFG